MSVSSLIWSDMIAEERVAEGLVCCGEAWSGRSKRCGLGGAVVGRLVEGMGLDARVRWWWWWWWWLW